MPDISIWRAKLLTLKLLTRAPGTQSEAGCASDDIPGGLPSSSFDSWFPLPLTPLRAGISCERGGQKKSRMLPIISSLYKPCRTPPITRHGLLQHEEDLQSSGHAPRDPVLGRGRGGEPQEEGRRHAA
jgi:hypothetical protein